MDALHRAESETLAATLDRPGPDVISASAAVVADPEMRARLRSEFVVWVDRNPDVLADQFSGAGHRPDDRRRPTRLLRGAVRNTRAAVPRDRRLRAATRIRSRSRRAGRRDRCRPSAAPRPDLRRAGTSLEQCLYAPTCATSRSSPTSITARPRSSTVCCGSRAPSAPTRTSTSGSWTRTTSSARRASRSSPRTPRCGTAT